MMETDDRILWFECYSGISGDMAVAAMLDLGVDLDKVVRVLMSLGLEGASVSVRRKAVSGLDVMDFDVVLEEDNHDHDMAYLYGKDAHHHDHGHHHHHHHEHRGLPEILAIIDRSSCSDVAKSIATRMFFILAEAEAKAHGVPIEKVHFHEVGAVDSIMDIVALAVCIDELGIRDIRFSELYEGTGCVRCQHGVLPVPVPAVVNIAAAHDLRMRITDSKGEYVTPTGAAFAAAIGNGKPLPREFRVCKVGMGGGKRESERSGILRAMIVRPASDETHAVKLECNIDDCSGEALGHAMERLFEAGARDVFYTPVYMKKNRPAYMLTVICRDSDADAMEGIMFSETTTIGIRRTHVERAVMDRQVVTVDTPIGPVDVKVCSYDGMRRFYPEYGSLSALCRKTGMPYREAYKRVSSWCMDHF